MKVLIVSEIEEERDQLGRILKNIHTNLEMTYADSDSMAMNLVSSDGPFAFFIIDVEMKNSDPDKLAQSLIDLAGDRPILFLGYESFITDRICQETYESNSSNDKLLRPIHRNDFMEDLTHVSGHALQWAKEEEFASSLEEIDPEEFVPMKIKSFYLFTEFPYDIYMEITQTKFIKIISANKPYTISTLAAYARKNIRYLHIRKDDQIKYLEEEAKKCLRALRKLDAKAKDIYIVLLRSITIHHQYMLTLGMSPTVLTLSNAITDSIIKIVDSYKSLKTLLKAYPYLYEGVASKSLLTGLISGYLCKKMGWDSVTTKKKLGMASILQDYTLPDESLSKINHDKDVRLEDFSDAHIKAFREHPTKVAQVAQQFTMFPDIDSLIESHHELPNRNGFPSRPAASKLTALNAVFNISQYFSSEIDGFQYSAEMNGKIIRSMNKDFSIGNFKEPLKILKETLGVKSS